MSWAALVLVALGGALGAPARFVVDGAVSARAQRAAGGRGAGRGGDPASPPGAPLVPPGTLAVNLSGALLLGLLAGSAPAGPAPLWLVAAGTGFCGAFTTFSTAALDAVRRAQDGRWGAAAATALTHLLGSLLAVGAGLALAAVLR